MIKKLIFIITFVLFSLSALAELNHYYKIPLHYENGEISYSLVNVIPSTEKLETSTGYYVVEVLSSDGDLLNLTYFNFDLILYYDSVDPETGEIGGGIIELNESDIDLYAPYYANAKEINIYDREDNFKLKIDVSSYSKEIPIVEEVVEIESKEELVVEKEMMEEPIGIKQETIGIIVCITFLILIILAIIFIRRKSSPR